MDIFAGVFGVVTARNRHAGGDPSYPPILPNEASCNLGKWRFIYLWWSLLCRLQKNDNWLRFSRYASCGAIPGRQGCRKRQRRLADSAPRPTIGDGCWTMEESAVAANDSGVCHRSTACGVSSDSAPSDSAHRSAATTGEERATARGGGNRRSFLFWGGRLVCRAVGSL
jgi:hypothetical protein